MVDLDRLDALREKWLNGDQHEFFEYRVAIDKEYPKIAAELRELRKLSETCDGLPASWYAAACRQQAAEMDAETTALLAEREGLRAALETMLRSAVPHPTEHPTMTEAWAIAKTALSAPPPDAVAKYEARIKREAQAEALSNAHKLICQRAIEYEYEIGEPWTWSQAATVCFEMAEEIRKATT